MKYILTFVVIQLFSISLYAQLKEEIELNLPEVPTSPAFILMGNSPSEIESPQTPADLNLSLQNASENFTAIPKNYSLSLAPYWLFRFKETSYTAWARGSGETTGNNILQSLQISVGVSDSIANKSRSNRFGAGFNFSIIRGNIDPVIERKYFDKLINLNTVVQSLQALAEAEDKLYNELEDALTEIGESISVLLEDTSRSLQDEEELEELEEQANKLNTALSNRQKELHETVRSEYLTRLKEELRKTKLTRIGFYLNLAGGAAWNYNRPTEGNSFYRGGLWVNSGYQGEKFNWIGVARFLSHDQVNFQNEEGTLESADFTTFDLGLKLEFDQADRVTLSGEYLYRIVPNTDIDPGYRAVLNLAYNITPDIMLNLTYGKDFELFLTGESQDLALFNLAFGIGQKRKLSF